MIAAILAAVAWVTLFRDPTDVRADYPPSKPIAVSAMPIIVVLPFANQTGDDTRIISSTV
jgi:hypothetical protein